ncbi:MAG: hypothetical protein OEY89_12215, partial [Gammaproteobacteria bacterium]|nr:hypothetical protein [Gammaproteobacteria bacterium]
MSSKGLTLLNRAVLVLIVSLTLSLTACGGDGGGTTTNDTTSDILTGVFIDSPVQDLKYVTDTLTGKTDANGTFQYREGEVIKFYIGDALIGRAMGAAILTPINFISIPTIDSPEIINALRVLQTLDTDSDPSNGITLPTIPDGIGTELDITSENEVIAFIYDIDINLVLINGETSLTHFTSTLEGIEPPAVETGVDYVFSHAYDSPFGESQIYTMLDVASLHWIDKDTIEFNVTLPSGYEVTYTGVPLYPYTSAARDNVSSIQWMDSAGTGMYVVVNDPTINTDYLVSFYKNNTENKAPSMCGNPQGTNISIDGTVDTHTISPNARYWNCLTDGDYVDSATVTVNYDGTLTDFEIIKNGLSISQTSTTYDVAFYEGGTLPGSRGQLIEKKDLSVQITATDSRGVTFTSEAYVISKAELGTGEYNTDISQYQNLIYYAEVNQDPTLYGSESAATIYTDNPFSACDYAVVSFTMSISDLTGNVDTAVSGSYSLSGAAPLSCNQNISGSFVSNKVIRAQAEGELEYVHEYSFTFDVVNGNKVSCAFKIGSDNFNYG